MVFNKKVLIAPFVGALLTTQQHYSTFAMSVDDETILGVLKDLEEWQQDLDGELQSTRPFVTAAFAQSLDGYMAPFANDESQCVECSTASNFALSGNESNLLTHALRSAHDGILIGGRTLSIDNPRLTNRLWKTRLPLSLSDAASSNENTAEYISPRPIVLDARLERVRKLGQDIRLCRPILCCSSDFPLDDHILEACRSIGAEILPCQLSAVESGQLDLYDVLRQLKVRLGLRHVMVEGGARILSSFLAQGLVDALCITVAPKFLHSGIAPSFCKDGAPSRLPIDLTIASSPRFVVLGRDTVLLSCFPTRSTRTLE
jgi:riboflavin-specific deaminase-like protein